MRLTFFATVLLIFGAEAFGNETFSLETIQVKGTKENKSYFEVPESIAILRENELPATGRENSLQVLNAVPNVEVNKNGESFSIRGINNTGVTGYQKDNLASIVIDDLFQTDLAIQSGSFSLWDMERVEVLRGAQSTNQGVNSLAGTILLDHQKPRFSREGAAKFGLGSFWHRELGLVANTTWLGEKAASRISYDKELNDGYIKNIKTGNSKWGRWDRDRANLGLSLKASENDLISFNAKFHRNDQGGLYTQGADPFRYEVNEDVDYDVKTTNYQLSTQYRKQIDSQLSNSAIVGYSKSHQDLASDADGTDQNTAGTRIERHDDHYVSFENRLHYKSDKLSHLFGIHIHDFKQRDDYDFNLLFPLGGGFSTPVAVQQGTDRKRRAFALFDSVTYRIDERHSLLGGLRGEYTESIYTMDVRGQRLQNLGGGTNAMVDNYISQVSGDYQGDKASVVLLPKIGYTLKSGAHFIGLTYTRGYRTAGVSVNRRRVVAVEYNPEFTNNYEVSYKYSGSGFQLGTNVFYIDWRDQQVQVQLSADFYDTQVENAARSEVFGAEIEGRYDLTSRQILTAGVGYADTKFKDFAVRGADYSGKRFPFSSNWTGRLAHEMKVGGDLSFFTVLRYLSDSYSNAENTRKSDAQWYLNWSAKYALGAWILEGYVNNAFDGKFRIFDGTPTSSTSPYQASYHQTNTPREIGARLSYYW